MRQLIDGSGNVLTSQTFDPYGAPYSVGGPAESSFGFTGEQVDENGLVYLRARYYNPSMGRFMQIDPSRLERNGYEYAGSSPTMYADPSGNICLDPTAPSGFHLDLNRGCEWIPRGQPGHWKYLNWSFQDIWDIATNPSVRNEASAELGFNSIGPFFQELDTSIQNGGLSTARQGLGEFARALSGQPEFYAGVHFWQATGNVLTSQPSQVCMATAPTFYSQTADGWARLYASRDCAFAVVPAVGGYLYAPYFGPPQVFPTTTADTMMRISANNIVKQAAWEQALADADAISAMLKYHVPVGGAPIYNLLGADEVPSVFPRPIRLYNYGEEFSAYSWLYRNETGLLGDMNYNVAVFEVQGEIPAGFFPQPAEWGDIRVYNGNIFVFSNIPDAMHSEAVGYTVLTEGGINTLSQVRALYTEFEPCAELCIPLLHNGFEFSPSLRITYSFPYNYPERELGRIIKEDTFRRFFGQ